MLGKRILNAHLRSPLYSSLDENKYLDQIKAVRIDNKTKEYNIQVDDRWYGSSGYYADFVQKDNSVERAIKTSENVEETTVDTYLSIHYCPRKSVNILAKLHILNSLTIV